MKAEEIIALGKKMGGEFHAMIDESLAPIMARLDAIDERIGSSGGKAGGGFDGTAFGKDVVAAVRDYVQRATVPILARLDEIETRGFRYRGVHQRAETYKRGDLVTHAGSVWSATRTVDDGTVPGEGAGNPWQMAVKAGRDGKDGGR